MHSHLYQHGTLWDPDLLIRGSSEARADLGRHEPHDQRPSVDTEDWVRPGCSSATVVSGPVMVSCRLLVLVSAH